MPSLFSFSVMQMCCSSLTHWLFASIIMFLYMTGLLPSSHNFIICILSLICANVVIICKCHTKMGHYCSVQWVRREPSTNSAACSTLAESWFQDLKHFGNSIPTGISRWLHLPPNLSPASTCGCPLPPAIYWLPRSLMPRAALTCHAPAFIS